MSSADPNDETQGALDNKDRDHSESDWEPTPLDASLQESDLDILLGSSRNGASLPEQIHEGASEPPAPETEPEPASPQPLRNEPSGQGVTVEIEVSIKPASAPAPALQTPEESPSRVLLPDGGGDEDEEEEEEEQDQHTTASSPDIPPESPPSPLHTPVEGPGPSVPLLEIPAIPQAELEQIQAAALASTATERETERTSRTRALDLVAEVGAWLEDNPSSLELGQLASTATTVTRTETLETADAAAAAAAALERQLLAETRAAERATVERTATLASSQTQLRREQSVGLQTLARTQATSEQAGALAAGVEREREAERELDVEAIIAKYRALYPGTYADLDRASAPRIPPTSNVSQYSYLSRYTGLGLGTGLADLESERETGRSMYRVDTLDTATTASASSAERHRDLSPSLVLASLDAKWSLPKDIIDLPPASELPATRPKSPPRSPPRSPTLTPGSDAKADAVLEDYLRSTRHYLSLGSSHLYSAAGSTATTGAGASGAGTGSLRASLLPPPAPSYSLPSDAAAGVGMTDTQLLVLCARYGCDEAVGRWLYALQLPNLAKYVEIFGQHEMDMESVRLLTIPQLHAMGIRAIGPLNKIIYAVRRMRSSSARHSSHKFSASVAGGTEVDAAARVAHTLEETVTSGHLEKRFSAEKAHFELPRGINPPSCGFESAREAQVRRSRSAKSENKRRSRSPPAAPAPSTLPPPTLASGLDRLEAKNAQLRELLNEHVTQNTFASKQHTRERVSPPATPSRHAFRPPRGSSSGTAAGAPPLTHPPMVLKSAPQPPLVIHVKPAAKATSRKSQATRSSQTPVSRGSQASSKRAAPKSEPPPPPVESAAPPPQPPPALELPARSPSPPPAPPRPPAQKRVSRTRHTEAVQTEGGFSSRVKQTRSSAARKLKASAATESAWAASCRTRVPPLASKRVAGRLASDRGCYDRLATRSKRSPRVLSACAPACVCRKCCGDSHFPFQDEIHRLESKIQHLLELSSAAYQRNLEKFSSPASSSRMHTSRARSNSSRAVLAGDLSARRSPRSDSLGAREATRLGECSTGGTTTTSSREARARVVDAGLASSRSLGDIGYTETSRGGERDRVDASGDLRLKSTQQLMQMIDRLQSRLLNIQARASEQHRLLVQEPQHEPPADLPLAPSMSARSASEDGLADGAGVFRELKPGALTQSKLELLKELVADDADSNPPSSSLEPQHRELPSPPTQDPGPSQRGTSRSVAPPLHSQRSPTKGSPHTQASRRGVETGKTFVLNDPSRNDAPISSALSSSPLQIPLEMKRTDLIFHQRMSEYVGEGQFTRVYRGALAQPTDARVELALKQVKTRLAHKERDYIIGEASALRSLSHGCPQLAKFYGFLLSTVSLDVYLVYEYLPFGSLYQYLHSIHATDPLEHVTFYALAREIALGMNFLHSLTPEPVLHLNLKSTNVMLTDQLHVRIADFGFNKLRHACAQACVASATLSSSRPNTSRASLSNSARSVLSAALAPNASGGLKKAGGYPVVPVYLPPEVLLLSGPSSDLAQSTSAPTENSGSAAASAPSPTDGQSTATEPSTASTGVERVLMPRSARLRGMQLSPKVDVYSYGIILYEMLYRKVPFDGYSLTQLIDGLRKRDRPQYQEGLTNNELERFITSCWHHVPVNRPSFTEILYRLEQLLLPGKWRQMLQKVPSLSPLAVVNDPQLARALLRHSEKVLAELGVLLPQTASKSTAEQTVTQPQPLGPGALEFATVTRFYDMLELSDAEIDYISSQIERVAQLGMVGGKDKIADEPEDNGKG